jgi:hypothetical protein
LDFLFHGTKAAEQFLTEFGDHSAATLFAAALRVHNRLGEHCIHGADQKPGSSILHIHGTASGGNGARFTNVLEQLHLSATDLFPVRKIDAQNCSQSAF